MGKLVFSPLVGSVVRFALGSIPNAQGVQVDGNPSPHHRVDVGDLVVDLIDLTQFVGSGWRKNAVQFDTFGRSDDGKEHNRIFLQTPDPALNT